MPVYKQPTPFFLTFAKTDLKFSGLLANKRDFQEAPLRASRIRQTTSRGNAVWDHPIVPQFCNKRSKPAFVRNTFTGPNKRHVREVGKRLNNRIPASSSLHPPFKSTSESRLPFILTGVHSEYFPSRHYYKPMYIHPRQLETVVFVHSVRWCIWKLSTCTTL